MKHTFLSARPLVFAALLALSTTAAAAKQPLTIHAFSGPKAAAAQRQLSKTVCARAQCSFDKTPKGRLPRKKKKKSWDLQGFVARARGATHVRLLLMTPGGEEAWRGRFRLTKKGTLRPADLRKASRQIIAALAAGDAPAKTDDEIAPPPEEVAEETPPASPSASSAATTDDKEEAATDAAADASDATEAVAEETTKRSDEEDEDDDDDERPKRSRAAGARPFLSVGLGAQVLNRSYALEGLQGATLAVQQTTPFWLMPLLRVELRPLASSEGILRNLGVTALAAYGFGVSSEIRGATDSLKFPNTYSQAELFVDCAIDITSGIFVEPVVGVTHRAFSTGAASDGTELDKLPDVSYTSAKVGANVGYATDTLRAWVGGAALPTFGAGEIISPAYFPAGSVFGIEAGGGASYRLMPFLDVALRLAWTRYGLTFTPEPTDAHQATGASDSYITGSLSAAYVF
nr:hypothetical protein [uncultured bacterium]